MKKISSFILRKIGWKIEGITDFPDKCVICVAPHTSNWDLFLGKLVYSAMGRKACFLIKKSWFFFPMNIIFNALGGIPVDRNRKTALTDQMVEQFANRNCFQLAITPEGTRKKNSEWKKGFYYIALAANVPIVIVILDYGKKTVDFRAVFAPTGDADADIAHIQAYYKDVEGKHPEKFTMGDNN
ncbi:acyltransferase [Dysgonomonas sp. 216]|uniref:1-acyl-sn-glycerol-3-phosphate acyltransferase n=1 Tax=Dysgonomonas sp. 216 TaxID=2302934 RepID=UPI0013CF6F41|nr:acyltransferase [Dysgonomonas sp. 216]